MSQETKQYPLCLMLTVRDMAKSLAFYRETLGFELREAWPDKERPLWANLVLDKQAIMLGQHMSPEELEKWMPEGSPECAEKVGEAREFAAHKAGVGMIAYVAVPDVDAFHARLTKLGVKASAPRTQFYGQRDFTIVDPDGYRLTLYTLVALSTCQSCSMPLTEAKPGQMFCNYCVDERGELKPYEAILEGCINGYFIPMQKMSRPDAERAARELLAKQPAWAGRK